MQTKLLIQQSWLGVAWLLLGLVINLVGAQEHPARTPQQGVTLKDTRTDGHSDTNESPRDKRFFAFSGFNGPHSVQPTVPFESLANYVQQQDQFGGRTGLRNFAPDIINTHANNQHFNTFNQMSSSQFGSFNGRTGNRPQGNTYWSQWGSWPYGGGFGGRSTGSWRQNNWGQYGQNWPWNQFGGRSVSGPWSQFGGRSVSGPWSQFGGRSVSGPWSQFGGRSGQQGGYWPGYGYGYGYRFGFRR